MFSASRRYFDGMERRSAEIDLESRARRAGQTHREVVTQGGGNIAVRRTVDVRVTEYESTATVTFEPPHPVYGWRRSHREGGDIINSSFIESSLVRAVEDDAQTHEAYVAQLVEGTATLPQRQEVA
jgi:hypothetical protein